MSPKHFPPLTAHAWPLLTALAIVLASSPANAQRRGNGGGSATVYKARLTPHWFDGGARFWYQNDLAGGQREFVLVDVEKGLRERAFDHDKLAAALRQAGVVEARGERLPIEALRFKLAEQAVQFRADNKSWRCDLRSYTVAELQDRKSADGEPRDPSLPGNAPRRSSGNGPETTITLINRTDGDVEIFWLNASGERQAYEKLAAGMERDQHTYAGHVWEAVNSTGRTLGTFEATEAPATAIIHDKIPQGPFGGLGGGSSANPSGGRSPDRKWISSVKDHNVFLRAADGEKEIQLSQDGDNDHSYSRLAWSPDSQSLVAFRIQQGDDRKVHLIESSPKEGGRAVLHTRSYPLPGDKFTSYELRLFHVADQTQIECNVDPIDFGSPRLRWNADGHTFTYQQTDRGHQRLRLIEVDAHTGHHRNLIDEQSKTFIWTAHMDGSNYRHFQWLNNTDEILYVSERDGWRHLYLVDAKEGAIKHQITQGNFVVRGIDKIDEERRQISFRASGRNPVQDPYFIHYYRINFDGTGLTPLTTGNGNHAIVYSPDEKYLIDTYSRVDEPPTHELRRASDGQLLCPLEQADITDLNASGWQAPEVFTAKGRDGVTDIWGIVCRPKGFDPVKKYPVIEQIYAGPHGSHVPKAFSSQRRFSALTDLGFVVVQIDGMGTANRSKAFHDVCWHNLKDAGFPDRILWHQALAAKYPWYDISRVGIYGTSAGGQNSTGALLFHPDFYKVGVSACGCHDNRMDKASWNEQWMGYPVGPHYADSSNIDNASRLKGKLLLIVGELDKNVPPESTLRLADALIKAGKDFDLLVIPGAGHGMGGAYGTRRMHDFFVRHLLGDELPNRNADK